MSAVSSLAHWRQFFNEFRCSRCGSDEGFVSRPRNSLERYVLPLIGMRPARCGDCFQRCWRPLRVQLLPRRQEHNSCAEGLFQVSRGTEKGTNENSGDQRRIA
jgi:hypothetical protein